jgi:hypothetical protein
MDLKATLKFIFTKPKKVIPPVEPVPEIYTLEDLFEPLEEDRMEIPDTYTLPEVPTERKIEPKIIKVSIFRRITAPILARIHERNVVAVTGLTTRQRIKRYDASMEGHHGIPAKPRKEL